ncbi:MAG: biopolymer transporter ExbD [Verrucomicrobiota bacterium]
MKLRSPLLQKKTRLEIIPLIDIMFFLLASFMLVSLSMTKQHSIKVSLPVASAAQKDIKPDRIDLAVSIDGSVYFEKKMISLPDLEALMRAKHAASAEASVFISADENARHGDTIRVLDLLRRIGFQKVAFNTKPAAPAGS